MWNTLKGWNMKVSEAKQKVCPFMEQRKPPIDRNCEYDIESKNINCICGDCMAWEETKAQREKTEYEKQREEEYKRAIKGISWNTTDLFIIEFNKDFDDVINIDLSLAEDKKEGYCKRLDK